MDQINCSIIPPGNQLLCKYTVWQNVLSTNKTALQVSGEQTQGIILSLQQAMVLSCVTVMQKAISQMEANYNGNVTITTIVDLPVRCESQFTMRDNLGNEHTRKHVSIGIYKQSVQVVLPGGWALPPQYMFILHCQMLPEQKTIGVMSQLAS